MTFCILSAVAAAADASDSPPAPPLVLEARISLGDVHGRIDHLAVDLARQHLFVAELGNDSVGVFDLGRGGLVRSIVGLDEPQGIAYFADTDAIYVASGGDGTVRSYDAASLDAEDTIRVGSDADNVRIDPGSGTVLVGNDAGALAIIDPARKVLLRSIALEAHPESFQLGDDGRLAYVNLPGAHAIAVVDIAKGQVLATWSTGDLRANYPMALEPGGEHLWVGFRRPARLIAFDVRTGAVAQRVSICGDTDDVFFDEPRTRIYVICGSGDIDVLDYAGTSAVPVARIPTRRGARTGLFAPALDRLYVAAPATGGETAVVLVYRPSPPLWKDPRGK